MPDEGSEEAQFVLALCGIVTSEGTAESWLKLQIDVICLSSEICVPDRSQSTSFHCYCSYFIRLIASPRRDRRVLSKKLPLLEPS